MIIRCQFILNIQAITPLMNADISGDKQQIIYNGINQPSLIIEGGGVGSNLIKN